MDWETHYKIESITRKLNAIECTLNENMQKLTELETKLENTLIEIWEKLQQLQKS